MFKGTARETEAVSGVQRLRVWVICYLAWHTLQGRRSGSSGRQHAVNIAMWNEPLENYYSSADATNGWHVAPWAIPKQTNGENLQLHSTSHEAFKVMAALHINKERRINKTQHRKLISLWPSWCYVHATGPHAGFAYLLKVCSWI